MARWELSPFFVYGGSEDGFDLRLQANVGEDESVTLDDFAAFDGDRVAEHGAVVDAGVELAVLAAGVDVGREVAEEIFVEVAAGEFAGEFFGIDADDAGFDSGCDHFVEEGAGVAAPDGKDRCEGGVAEVVFAVATNVFEVEVTEGYGADAVGDGGIAGFAHGFFVVCVGTGPGERNDLQGEACSGCLRFEDFAASAVHGDAIEGGVEGGEEACDFVVGIALQSEQGPGAVFAAAPRDEGGDCHCVHAS